MVTIGNEGIGGNQTSDEAGGCSSSPDEVEGAKLPSTIEAIHDKVDDAREALADAMLACAAQHHDDFMRFAGEIYHHLNDIDNDVEALYARAGAPLGRR
jgi:hypothetical protein